MSAEKQINPKAIALHLCQDHSSEYHLLDHLAPLCFFLKIPLMLSEKKDIAMVEKFYPQIQTIYKDQSQLHLDVLLNYDFILHCKSFAKEFVSLFPKRKTRFIYCPHGHSEKIDPLLDNYPYQDILLLYGNHMVQILKKINLWPKLSKTLVMGNLRLAFYKKHQTFYSNLVKKDFLSQLDPKKKTLLYAPTWHKSSDLEKVFSLCFSLIHQLPPHYNLILKLHPSLEKAASNFINLLLLSSKKKSVVILSHCPVVFPILQKCDVFLGDASSVGYDFLYFQKPMFFTNTHEMTKTDLHQCGTTISSSNIFSFIETNLSKNFAKQQKKAYRLAFANKNLPTFLSELKKMIQKV